jgi:regulator of RNase E activity RraA
MIRSVHKSARPRTEAVPQINVCQRLDGVIVLDRADDLDVSVGEVHVLRGRQRGVEGDVVAGQVWCRFWCRFWFWLWFWVSFWFSFRV